MIRRRAPRIEFTRLLTPLNAGLCGLLSQSALVAWAANHMKVRVGGDRATESQCVIVSPIAGQSFADLGRQSVRALGLAHESRTVLTALTTDTAAEVLQVPCARAPAAMLVGSLNLHAQLVVACLWWQ
jgi:hypothetical protein